MPFMFNPNQGVGQFTPEERAYYLGNMPDLTEQEEELERQRALSKELRGRAAGGRMDWASQANRALQGAMSGYAHSQADKGGKQLRNDLRFFHLNMPGSDYRKRLELAAPMDAFG